MGIVTVSRRIEGRTSQTTVTPTGMTTNAQLILDVIVDDPNDDEPVVMIHPDVPLIGISTHPAAPWLFCREVEPVQEQALRWALHCNYSGPGGMQNGNPQFPDDPTAAPAKARWGSVTYEEPIDTDQEGRPLSTICGEPFDPQERITRRDLVLTLDRTLRFFDPSIIVPYTDEGGAVASDSVFFQPAGTARLNHISADSIPFGGETYWNASCEIQFRRGRNGTPDSRAFWRRKRAEGFYCFVDLSSIGGPPQVLVHAKQNGQNVTRPVLHYAEDGPDHIAGEQIPITSDNPWPLAEWYYFQVHPELPFRELGFF